MIVVADTSPLNYLLDLPQALVALQATNFHVSPELIEVLLANDAKRQRNL